MENWETESKDIKKKDMERGREPTKMNRFMLNACNAHKMAYGTRTFHQGDRGRNVAEANLTPSRRGRWGQDSRDISRSSTSCGKLYWIPLENAPSLIYRNWLKLESRVLNQIGMRPLKIKRPIGRWSNSKCVFTYMLSCPDIADHWLKLETIKCER